MSPAVSVVIAARNCGQYLASTLGSVQRQTFTDWECLLVDDGSDDNTGEIVRPFLADNRFRFIQSDWVGQTRSKNLAFRLTSAPLIAPLDGDDVWMPSKLERQVRLLRSEPNVGVVFTRRFLMDFEGAILPAPRMRFKRGTVFNDLIVDNYVCYSSTVFRREILEHVGAFDERLELGIDFDFWLRVSRHYEFDFIDEALVKYRTGHSNLSQRLADRITLVLSAIRRTLTHRGGAEKMPSEVVRATWASTYRTMGYVLRTHEPACAAWWYLLAATMDRRWGATTRAMLRCARNGFRRTFTKQVGNEANDPNSTCNL